MLADARKLIVDHRDAIVGGDQNAADFEPGGQFRIADIRRLRSRSQRERANQQCEL